MRDYMCAILKNKLIVLHCIDPNIKQNKFTFEFSIHIYFRITDKNLQNASIANQYQSSKIKHTE
jgi:hypothetical protein